MIRKSIKTDSLEFYRFFQYRHIYVFGILGKKALNAGVSPNPKVSSFGSLLGGLRGSQVVEG